MPEELVPTSELARALGLSVRTVQRYVREGKLTPDLVTPGRQWRWDVDRVRRELAPKEGQ